MTGHDEPAPLRSGGSATGKTSALDLLRLHIRHAAGADMLILRADQVRPGDVIGNTGAWSAVRETHREPRDGELPAAVRLVLDTGDGRVSDYSALADWRIAVLRRDPAAEGALTRYARRIHNEADSAIRGASISQRASFYRIRDTAERLLAAFQAERPACEVCGAPGAPVEDGTGRPYALCGSDDQAHTLIRDSIALMRARLDRLGANTPDGGDTA